MTKLIIIGGAATGAIALIAGVAVPIVVKTQQPNRGNQEQNPDLPSYDSEKITELKQKLIKGLEEANSKIKDANNFVEYYNALRKELNREKTSESGVKYVLSEVSIQNTTYISTNDKISIKYDFKFSNVKDFLFFEFKNPAPEISPVTKVNELRQKFIKGLEEANSKMIDENKFVEYYYLLNSQLNKEQTSESGVKYVLSELKVANTSDIKLNKEISIRYNFELGQEKNYLTFEFKNPNPNPGKPEDKTDWQKVRLAKQNLLSKIEESSKTKSFEELYNLYLNELNQIKIGDFNTTIKLIDFKGEFPKVEKISSNSYFIVKYEVAFNGYDETLEYKFVNPSPIKNIKMVNSLTSYKENFVVSNGIIVQDFRNKDENAKFDEVVIPEFVETDPDSETGVILKAQVIGIGDNLYKKKQVKSIKFEGTSLKSIGRYAFAYNDIYSLDLSHLKNLEFIGEGAFRTNKIEKLLFPHSLKTIDIIAFYDNRIKELYLSNTQITTVSDYAFSKNKIDKLKFNWITTEIGERAFYDNNLTIDAINNSNLSVSKVKFISWYAFGHQVQDLAFNYQTNNIGIEDQKGIIKLPDSLELIGRGAFEIKKEIQWWDKENHYPMSYPKFVFRSDTFTYSKRLMIYNEDETKTSYARWYDLTSRAYFNASLINWNYAQKIPGLPRHSNSITKEEK